MRKLFLLLTCVSILSCQITYAQDSDNLANCSHDGVIDWIHKRHDFELRFEEADANLSNNLTDWRRLPRVDLLVEIQNIRREFEWLEHPPCTDELYFLTSLYWTQRIDMLALSLASNSKRDSREDTQGFYQDILLPAIYRLEGAASFDYFSEISQERPSEAPVPTNIKIGEVIINNTNLEKVIAVEPITLPKCNGSSELVISREFTKSTDRRLILHAEGEIDASIGIAKAHLEAFSSLADNHSISESLEVEMRAAPGSTVTYEIDWVEVSTSGILEISENDTIRFVEFSVPEMLRANVRQPIQAPCNIEPPVETSTPTS
ncbi:MAG: hypothetical protein K8J31_30680 [Anaerolineae bacterium]|nr:hypothetical protein [Anaerolineae bacterium]